MNLSRLPTRIALGAIVGLIATIAYRSIQFVSASGADLRAECWTWQWLPFSPKWIWPYLSMFLLVGLPWFFLPTLRQVQRFAFSLLVTAAVGWTTFIVYPTACVRPTVVGKPIYYAWLLALDGPNNCLPCLHSAFSGLAVLALIGTPTIFRRTGGVALLGLWLTLICISIVALRQHTDVDTVAGLLLGGMGACLFQVLTRGTQKAASD